MTACNLAYNLACNLACMLTLTIGLHANTYNLAHLVIAAVAGSADLALAAALITALDDRRVSGTLNRAGVPKMEVVVAVCVPWSTTSTPPEDTLYCSNGDSFNPGRVRLESVLELEIVGSRTFSVSISGGVRLELSGSVMFSSPSDIVPLENSYISNKLEHQKR